MTTQAIGELLCSRGHRNPSGHRYCQYCGEKLKAPEPAQPQMIGDRYRVMYQTQWLQDAEKSFLNDPESYLGQDNIQRLNQIYDLIQLDFMGIDFTVTQDGKLFVFETNAAMRHNFDHAVNFPYTEPFLNRVSLAFNDMVQRRLGA